MKNPEFMTKLVDYFQEINVAHFSGELPLPRLEWNSRIRTSSGRFTPGTRGLTLRPRKPLIELALYLLEETNAEVHIKDTLAHEMIHYWLWWKRKPYGHTPEFLGKMKAMGVSRYNPVPRKRPSKYLYQCPECKKEYPARKRWRSLACGECCKKFSKGKFDARFKLKKIQPLSG